MSWGRFCRRASYVLRGAWCVPSTPLACTERGEVARVRGTFQLTHHASRIIPLLIFGLLWLLRPQSLYAHNELRQSIPSAGEILTESPATIQLQFSEPPASVFIRLFDRRFNEVSGVEILPVTGQEFEVVAHVPTLNPGVYTVQWLTLSQDNHAISGTFQFEVQGTTPSTLINSSIMGVLAAAILAGIMIFWRQTEPIVNSL